ncbi:MAG: ribonuclease R [Candidatus Pseudobacter hemicellulosilyticus]|uniref:Ribonuclease R n=1 Tax=Candidatus Pseudobacter hemicellulosilyticus TaxID=3121375 RepID=A0AAJ5WP56_9BACT|nr:MAG: ribonuclease R [Pseudobacter sp.]
MSKKHQKKNRKRSAAAQNAVKGRLDITRSGMGYVIVDGRDNDVLVRPNDFNTALHGDTVRVSVSGSSQSGRSQGKVIQVLQRKQTEFLGKIELGRNVAFFVADVDKPMPDFFIPPDKLNGASHNDRVIVRLAEWEPHKKPVGEVVQLMTPGNEGDLAMKEILMENGFPLLFPEAVTEETARIPDTIGSAEIAVRKDCRDILTFTIDPVDAKDFDDALSFRVLKNGYYEIGVHIADVSHYVQPGTALDDEAYNRATSVYLPDRVLPMLPERISNELCSLRPNEDKLTFAAIFQMTPKGEIKHHWLGRTVIHSDHRFAYEEVQEIIEKGEGLYMDEILLLNNLAQKLRKQRFKKGAINFSSQEVRFKLDETGKPIGIVIKESKEAHQLIEEFMLLANRYVAEDVSKVKVNKKDIPFPYRVHDTPDEVKLLPFVEFARKYGHSFDLQSPETIAASFNQLLKDVQGKPEQHVLEQLGIRTMAKAIYTSENIGHYGLGFESYCHFTSPIRRYPDILVHRILDDVLRGTVQPDKKMEQKCKHCSERERSAMDAERASNKYKQVEYMQAYLGEEFDGVISGVAAFGFWVETIEHKCEGLVSINSLLEYDDFRLIEGDYSLAGMRSGRKFRMGDKVRIRVIAANLAKRQLDYEWVIAAGMAEAGTGSQTVNPSGPAPKGSGQGHAASRGQAPKDSRGRKEKESRNGAKKEKKTEKKRSGTKRKDKQ